MLRTLKRNLRRSSAISLKSVTFETAVFCNLTQLRLFSIISGAPFGATDEAALFVDSSQLKHLWWTASLGFTWLRALFVAGAVTLSLTLDRFRNPMFMPLYVVMLVCTLSGSYMGYSVLTCQPGCYAMTWNFILKHKSKVKSPKSLVWFMCFGMPSIHAFNMAFNVLLALNPHLVIQFRFAVYLALEEGLLTPGPTYWALVVASTLADFWSFFLNAGIICNMAISHMLFLETWTSVMNQLLNSCKERVPSISAQYVWRRLQQLTVAIRVFNIGNASAVFAFKLKLLGVSISCLSALIILDFRGNLLFLGLVSYAGVAVAFYYPSLYHRAYGVSAGLEMAKSQLLQVRQFRMSDGSFDRRLRAISPKGVQVGGFRTFERESDLIYLDFIVNQVTGIVLL